MGPTAGQFYGSQIPTMGMNITNITNHIQKPNMNSVSIVAFLLLISILQQNWMNPFFFSVSINLALQVMYISLFGLSTKDQRSSVKTMK